MRAELWTMMPRRKKEGRRKESELVECRVAIATAPSAAPAMLPTQPFERVRKKGSRSAVPRLEKRTRHFTSEQGDGISDDS